MAQWLYLLCHIHCIVGTNDFDKVLQFRCGIKFWKSSANLGPVKKNFSNIERFLAYLAFEFSKSIQCPSKRWKLFFFKYGQLGIKKSIFHTDLKNVNLIIVKSAPKKLLARKTVLPIEEVPKKSFLGQNLFWVHFLVRSKEGFLNQHKKTDLLIPHSTYSKKKSFIS